MNLQSEILGLSVAYALVGTLVLLGVARGRWPWAVKAAAIVLTSAFYVLVFFRSEGLLGWSATAALPRRFEVLWALTVEPDSASHDPGAVHLWVQALDPANMPTGEPRAYRLPYSTRLAGKVEAVRTEIQAGHPQEGRTVEQLIATGQAPLPEGPVAAPGAEVEAGGDPATGGALDPAFLGDDTKSVDFAPLPRSLLPPKDAPSRPN